MPKRAFDRLVATGLLNEPGDNGRWDDAELERLDVVIQLGREARDLDRRAVLLTLNDFPVALHHRRRAVVELVSSIRPGARKMREVRRELFVLHRRTSLGLNWLPQRKPRSFAIPVPRDRWRDVIQSATDEEFQQEYHVAAFYTQILPGIMRAERQMPAVEVRPEERLALILVNLLLRHPGPRSAAALPPLPVRQGLDIVA